MSKLTAFLLVLFVLFASFLFVKPVFSDNLAENTWVSKASMHQARAYLSVAVVNEKIYAIGGDSGGYMGNAGTATGKTSNVVGTNEEYNPTDDTWTLKESMPTPRAGLGIAVYEGKIYCIGGWTKDYSDTNVNEVYDPATNSWETKSSLPSAQSLLTANVVNSKIYVLPLLSTDTFEVYDPETDSWASKTPPPYQVTGFTSAVIGNKIFFEGGLQNSSMQSDIQVYDTVTDSWSTVSSRPSSFDLYGAGGVTSGVMAPSRIYFFMDNVTNIYDPNIDSWATGASMPTIRYCTGVTVVADTFFVVGGRSGSWGYFVDMHASAVTEQYIPVGYVNVCPVVSPQNKTYNECNVPLTFAADKLASRISYSLDGKENVTITGNITLTGLTNGNHTLIINAKDEFGNDVSETINFKVEAPEAFSISFVLGFFGVSVGLAVLGLFVYKKHIHSQNFSRSAVLCVE
ncbi:MAG: Kelch repeat-containing protein [Candidatus Bathyarchaeia archaeon]